MKNNSPWIFRFFGFLTLIFITLKLINYIDWSWWFVLAPLWGRGPFVAIFSLFLAYFVLGIPAIFSI